MGPKGFGAWVFRLFYHSFLKPCRAQGFRLLRFGARLRIRGGAEVTGL